MAYMGGVTGGVAGAIAAAEKRRQEIEEEERMTTYTPDELQDDWEFKIVRSSFEAFRKPETLHRVIAEEAHAGWVLVEKFDNNRLRFKRPASARANDATLPSDVDPYRTHIGGSGAVMAGLFIGLLVLLTVGLVAFTIMMAT